MGKKKKKDPKRKGSSKKQQVSQFKRQLKDFKTSKVIQQKPEQLDSKDAQQFRKPEWTYEFIESPKQLIVTIEAITKLLITVAIFIIVLFELSPTLFVLIHNGKSQLPPMDMQLIKWLGMAVDYYFTKGH